MAEAIALEVINKLSSPVLQQLGLWWNFKDDLDDLKSVVSAIEPVLLVKDFLEKLKDTLYDADDLLDDIHTDALRKDLLSGNKLTKEVRLFFSRSNQFAYGLKMSRKIKAIKVRLTSIESDGARFHVIEPDRPVETSFKQTYSFVRKDEIIGRDNDKAAILNLLFEFESDENVLVIPIVGLGGLGKTALAQLVYNDEMVDRDFELKIWVCVSDVFYVKKVVENIIKSVTNQAPNRHLYMDQLQKQLRDQINGKKYLLVLDDVRNEDREKWFSLKKLLMCGAKGSRIIVTTRSPLVAKITSKCHPHVVEGLPHDDAWFLFKKIAFEQRSADSTNSAFVEIGKQILEKCGGVPLVIRTIAGTLSFKESVNGWLSFKDNELATISHKEGDNERFSIMSGWRQQKYPFVRKDEIIGMDNDKAALLKLMFEFESEENVLVIPIVGLGGLGKTTLAWLVYNDEMVNNHFELKMLVRVSEVFDVKRIVEDIIGCVRGQAPDKNLELDQLQKQLRDEIDGKKYLLVLDDIWNEDREKLVSLKRLLMGGAKGSRIIITSRFLRVAKIASKCQPHVMKGLSDYDAWFLFKKIAFEPRPADSTNPAFVGIGKQILEKCDGVPLVIRSIAGTLSCKETASDWLYFKDKELAAVFQNEGLFLSTLELSYDHLPSHLKHCFAYCLLYPKGDEIDVQSLVQFWIAQGFVKQSNLSGQSLEEIGFGYFKELVARNFFQEVEEGDWVKPKTITGKMYDLALSVAGTESSIVDSKTSACEIDEGCRHISINPSLIPLFKGKKLRTLLRFPDKRVYDISDGTWDLIISNCRCLRVLDLHGSRRDTVPSIHKLKLLRYLDLSWNDSLKILPRSICKIQNLRVLKLDRCHMLKELPKKIEKLVNLTHLENAYCESLTHMPRGIGKLTSLQTLSLFVVDKDGSHGSADISELSGLNNLRGELRIKNLGFVKNAKEKLRAANLKEKQHLGSLVLEWSSDNDDEEKSLEDLQPHPMLKRLVVDGWKGDAKVPSWLSFLTNLVEIEIEGPSKFKHLPSFAQFPRLQRLMISELSEVEYMDDNNPVGRLAEPESFFSSLTLLHLRKCPKMKSWWRKRPIDDDNNEGDTTEILTSTITFPCLSHLWIEDCPLTSMPLYPSLDDELLLVNTSSKPLKQTIQMHISSSSIAPSSSSSSSTSSLPLSKLKSFRVKNIEELEPEMLDECLQNMSSLEGLDIGSCHWLKSFSGLLQQLTGLERLKIRDCKELDLEDTQWEPLKNLSELVLDNIPQLVSLPLWLQHLVQLKTLEITNCSGLRSLFPVFQHLTSLETLLILDCNELELSAPDIQIFQDFTSLACLHLQNILKCQHLPEWLQHLTNLRKLHLQNLPNLASLPDKMSCLTTLEELHIQQIPQLEERCRKDSGADWDKISHIPNIWVHN